MHLQADISRARRRFWKPADARLTLGQHGHGGVVGMEARGREDVGAGQAKQRVSRAKRPWDDTRNRTVGSEEARTKLARGPKLYPGPRFTPFVANS